MVAGEKLELWIPVVFFYLLKNGAGLMVLFLIQSVVPQGLCEN